MPKKADPHPLALIFDTETTGLVKHPDADLHKQPKMIEFGGALLSLTDGHIVEELNMLIDPQEPIDADIQRITGLTDTQLRGQPTFDAALPEIRSMFSRAVGMVAHNLPFDKAIIRGELARRNIEDFPWPKLEMCTVGLYREQWGRNPKLTELYEALMGKPLAQTHRALEDCKAMVEFIQKEKLWELL